MHMVNVKEIVMDTQHATNKKKIQYRQRKVERRSTRKKAETSTKLLRLPVIINF
jgi:hypothetical protein